MQTKLLSVLAILSVLVTGAALADGFKPAVVYDIGGKFDKSFNESVWSGVQKFTGETGIEVKEFQITNATQRQQAMRRLLERGATMVIAVGFSQADAIDAVAGEYPDRQFAIIDVSWLDRPNLRQYVFKEHEGSYLVGIAAALASRTGKVGFVGGMDIPLIRKFHCGYFQGAKAAGGGLEVLHAMIGTTSAAWNDPTKAAELAQGQIDRGAVQDALPGQETGGRLSPRCGKVFPRKGFDVAKLRTVRDGHVCQTPELVGKKEGG